MECVCDEIEASLYRSKVLIEHEARLRMYFYPQSRGAPTHNVGPTNIDNGTGPQSANINGTLRLKKYWNLFPKKKNKKVTDTVTARDVPQSWSSVKDRYGTVSGSISFNSEFRPKLSSPVKARGALISPWENYSSSPEVVLEEPNSGRVSPSKRSQSPVRKPKGTSSCTCANHPANTYGSVRVAQLPTSCLCSSKGRTRFGTARPVMTSVNRKSIFNSDSSVFSRQMFDTNSDKDDEDDSDPAYGSMYDSSSDSYSRIGKYVKNSKSSNSSIYGTLRSRKSILECDVNPYDLVKAQADEDNESDEVANNCDLEDDDLSPQVSKKETKFDKKLRDPETKKKEKSKFSIYSKNDKSSGGTLRIGGRAMAFNLQKERKMPKAYKSPVEAPKRSVSVPDIRLATTNDNNAVINRRSSISLEPKPDYATSTKFSSKVPSLTKLYNSFSPSKDPQASKKIPSVSSIISRKARTPSPTRKASTPFQSNGVIYGITPLRRPKAPPPPPPPNRTVVRQNSICDNPSGDSTGRRMETICETGANQLSTLRKTSFSGPTDLKSIIKRPLGFENKQDTCSETSSSAYGSMNSEIKREVKSILKKGSSVDGGANRQKNSHTYGTGGERKKQVKFKSASDNSLLIEHIDDEISSENENDSVFEDNADEIYENTRNNSNALNLQQYADDFVSVGECTVTNNVSPVKNSSGSVKFELRCADDRPSNSNIVSRTVLKNNNSNNVCSGIVAKTLKKFGSEQKVQQQQTVADVKCSVRPWSSKPDAKPNNSLCEVNVNDNVQIQTLQSENEPDTISRPRQSSKVAEFPDFNPDDDWLSPKRTPNSSSGVAVSVPKNVEASPTMIQKDNGSLMARGSEEPEPQQSSAKIIVKIDSEDQVTTLEVNQGDQVSIEGTSIQCEPPYDNIKYDTSTNIIDSTCGDSSPEIKSETDTQLVFESTEEPEVLKMPEDSEIDELYDDIAGCISEPIYEELPNSNMLCASPKIGERKSIFDGASKTEILSILNSAKDRVISEDSDKSVPKYTIDEDDEISSDPGIDLGEIKQQDRNHPNRLSNLSNISDASTASDETSQTDPSDDQLLELLNHNTHRRRRESAEIERNDSGVGSETSKPSKVRRHSSNPDSFLNCESNDPVCEDCEEPFDTNSLDDFPLVCQKCHKRRVERKEIITEFVETEIKYGNDLKILKEEFYKPMQVAGLLICDQLQSIFINLDELRQMNKKFVEKLSDALEIANEQGDEHYSTVSIGKLFLDSTPMLHGFETYCVQQSAASVLLNNLEKEKELLRVFLCVSQMENTLLRRMNLHAFLMVPVQRVTKYPLLLNRLYKVTPHHHKDRDALKDAQKKIEVHLEHINLQTKGASTTKIWRKISNISIASRRPTHVEEVGNIKLRTMALELLQWNREEVNFMKEGRLLYTQPSECIKRNKSVKFISVYALLVTLGRPDTNPNTCKATLLLVKEKANRLALLREQLPLEDCVISTDQDTTETFEVHLVQSKDYFICKTKSKEETEEWAKVLKKHAKSQGRWRQRRNALANIMISGVNRH